MGFSLGITDAEIYELLNAANCLVRKIQHSETQTHVWFFCADNKSRKEAVDMAYKLKGKYAATKLEHEFSGTDTNELTARLASLLAEVARGDEDNAGA